MFEFILSGRHLLDLLDLLNLPSPAREQTLAAARD